MFQPIFSYGIICFNINNKLNINLSKIEKYLSTNYLDIFNYNFKNLKNINDIPLYYDNIKFLMIRRKHSLNYIEFIRGRYELYNINKIKQLFELMTQEEILKIRTCNFYILWNELWDNNIYKKDYINSKKKFDQLKKNNFNNYYSNYLEPEWGFPKGRKNNNEKNLDCALREFNEETNINISDINILERIKFIEEEYKGTNLINYKHVYYLSSVDTELKLNNIDNYEISAIRWMTLPEIINNIRPYYNIKIKIIYQIYFFIINLIININNS